MLARPAITAVLVIGALSASADTAPGSLLERFMTREDTPLTSYRAFRTLRAENARFSKRARMEARTALSPEEGFTFEVVTEEGSGTVRKKVLRAALEAEARAIATGEAGTVALSSTNYEFGAPERLEDGLSRIPMTARRKEPLLINGGLVLNDDADLVRIEGQLVKKPSFWVNRAEVVREYARIGGVRVPIRVTSTAYVKMAGRSTFEMTYAYDSINGLPVASAGR
jgi:hypothetical protein